MSSNRTHVELRGIRSRIIPATQSGPTAHLRKIARTGRQRRQDAKLIYRIDL